MLRKKLSVGYTPTHYGRSFAKSKACIDSRTLRVFSNNCHFLWSGFMSFLKNVNHFIHFLILKFKQQRIAIIRTRNKLKPPVEVETPYIKIYSFQQCSFFLSTFHAMGPFILDSCWQTWRLFYGWYLVTSSTRRPQSGRRKSLPTSTTNSK